MEGEKAGERGRKELTNSSVVVSVTRARRSARRRISVFMARSGGVSVNKQLWSLAIVCWSSVFPGIFVAEREVWSAWSCERVGCRSLCGYFFALSFVYIFGEGKGKRK